MSDATTTAAKLIESRFNTQWAGALPIQWENVPFNQPANGRWVALTLRFGLAQQASIGSRVLEKIRGLVIVQVFWPKGTGTREAFGKAQNAAEALHYTQLSESGVTVDLLAGSVNPAEDRAEAFQVNTTVEFQVRHLVEAFA